MLQGCWTCERNSNYLRDELNKAVVDDSGRCYFSASDSTACRLLRRMVVTRISILFSSYRSEKRKKIEGQTELTMTREVFVRKKN